MSLTDSSYIVGDSDLNEFRQKIEKQDAFINNEINRFKSSKSIDDFGSLIATVLMFIAIFQIDKNIFLTYWIDAISFFIVFVTILSLSNHFKRKKDSQITQFRDPKQAKIAYMLSVKALTINLKDNDLAYFLIWFTGLLVSIYNFFENKIEINIYIPALFVLIVLFSLFLLSRNEVIYDFHLWIHTKVTNPYATLELFNDHDIKKALKSFNFRELIRIDKEYILYVFCLTLRDILLIVLVVTIIPIILNGVTWDIFTTIFLLFVFQVLIYVTLSSFLSFKKIEEVLDNQKIMLIRATTFLDKQSIDQQQLNKAKNYLKLSKLFIAHKKRFAIIFSWAEAIPNGELNIEENYDLLYQELGIPQE